jgi:hypothetical protein
MTIDHGEHKPHSRHTRAIALFNLGCWVPHRLGLARINHAESRVSGRTSDQ